MKVSIQEVRKKGLLSKKGYAREKKTERKKSRNKHGIEKSLQCHSRQKQQRKPKDLPCRVRTYCGALK